MLINFHKSKTVNSLLKNQRILLKITLKCTKMNKCSYSQSKFKFLDFFFVCLFEFPYLCTFSLYLAVNELKHCLEANSDWLPVLSRKQNPCWDDPIGVKGLLLTVPESTRPSSRTKGCKTLLVCVPQIFDDPPQPPNIHKHGPYPSTYIQPQHVADYRSRPNVAPFAF